MTKKKIFVVGVVIGITLLIGGSLVLSENIFPKKGITIEDVNKAIQKIVKQCSSEECKKLKGFKVKEVIQGGEGIKEEEAPVTELSPEECEKNARKGACAQFMERADPNERSEEICDIYLEAGALVIEGKKDKAKALLEKGIERFPESRHLHKELAHTLWYLYDGKVPSLLEQAIKEAETSLNIGMSFGQVDYQLTALLSMLLGESKDVKTLDRIFERVFAADDNTMFYEDYVDALIKIGDPRTEEMLKKGNMTLTYAVWLLDQGRENEVLLLLPTGDDPYICFYRGIALERLGQLDEARAEYAKYKAYRKMEAIPMPKRFQIPGSELQKEMKIRFEGDESSIRIQATTAIADEQAIKGLSYLIWGEAKGETLGGMRAVGWIVRDRVLRGSVKLADGRLCPRVVNTGSTLAEQYRSVMCQSSQFDGMCLAWCSDPNTTKCTNSTTTSNTASWVYNGYDPDPVSPHCPGGITNWGGSYCADSTECTGYYKDTYKLAGPVFNYGTGGSCQGHHTCANSVGKTCGNGGLSDNCFYSNPSFCVGSSCVTYNGSVGQGQCWYPSYFYSSVTGYHKGHLEGPESTFNEVDFDLYFWKWNGSSWQRVSSSIRYGSVDDINYYGTSGYYIWGVCAYTGSGNFKLYTSRPQ